MEIYVDPPVLAAVLIGFVFAFPHVGARTPSLTAFVLTATVLTGLVHFQLLPAFMDARFEARREYFSVAWFVFGGAAAALLLERIVAWVRSWAGTEATSLKDIIQAAALGIVEAAPGGSYIQDAMKKEIAGKVTESRLEMEKTRGDRLNFDMPEKGLPADEVLKELHFLSAPDQQKLDDGKLFGFVYQDQSNVEHYNLLTEAYKLFCETNPLSPGMYPSTHKFEREIVRFTAKMLNGSDEACGSVTSGGSESIIMAIKATRDWFLARNPDVLVPEIIVATSGHPACNKAAEMFRMKVHRIPCGPDFRADVAAFKAAMNRNTCMFYASAPCFPQGVVDPIEELGAIAADAGIGLHVDCCLGGFVLPWLSKLEPGTVPKFDFQVPGVTSISADTHKYGYGARGTSVVVFRDHEIRKHMFFSYTEYSGGLYITPTLAGTRPGGLMAATWAVMMHLGKKGYMDAVKKLMYATRRIQKGIEAIPELIILGKPEMCAFSFTTTPESGMNIYVLAEALGPYGWKLNHNIKPKSLQMSVTLTQARDEVIDKFLSDLRSAVEDAKAQPEKYMKGNYEFFELGASLPDRQFIRTFLKDYLDVYHAC